MSVRTLVPSGWAARLRSSACGLWLIACTAQQPEATEPPCADVPVDEWIDVSRTYEPSADGGLKYRNGQPPASCLG